MGRVRVCVCVRGQRQLSCRSVAVGGKTWLSFELPAVRGELSRAELPWQFSTGHRQHARAPNQHHQPASPPAPHLACRNTKTKRKRFQYLFAYWQTALWIVLCISHWSKVIRIRHCHLAAVVVVVFLKSYYRFVHIKYECSVSVWVGTAKEMCPPTHILCILYIHV